MNPLYVNARSQIRASQNVKVLQQGSSVLVRVIADKGGGQYEGSVAGVRVNLRSKNPLKPGDTFTATVNLNNGKIEITPKAESGISFLADKVFVEAQGQSQLQNLLAEIGLPPDDINSHIALQMKQLGMKLDAEVIRKLHALSIRFAGKEKKAAELLTILKDKGIELSQTQLLELLNLLEKEADGGEEAESPALKIINHKSGWIFLPYEIVNDPGNTPSENEPSLLGRGIIRLLIGDDKKLSKLNFNLLINNNEYLFNLDFENKKCKKIRCNFPVKESEVEKTLDALEKKLLGCGAPQIIFAEKSELEGSGCESEEFFEVGGRV